MRMHLTAGSFLICLLALPGISAADCSTSHACKKCYFDGAYDHCLSVKYDAKCTCTIRTNHPIACESTGICDYTGRPACSNPTPTGECPGSGFAPTIPSDETDASPGEADQADAEAAASQPKNDNG